MATIYTTRTLEPIQGGTKQVSPYDSFGVETTLGAPVPSLLNTFDPKSGRQTVLLMGTRSRSIASVEAISYQGSRVDIDAVDTTRKYRLLKEEGVGKRAVWFTSDTFYTPDTLQGDRVKPVLTGVSTYGISYTPTIAPPQEKRIRRWPRDWHGENMN